MNKRQTFEYVVNTTAETLKISRYDAEQRVSQCIKRGIMNGGNPYQLEWKKKIDFFMQGIGEPIKYFKIYSEWHPAKNEFMWGIEAVCNHGFSFVVPLVGENKKMFLKDKSEAERVIKMFETDNEMKELLQTMPHIGYPTIEN